MGRFLSANDSRLVARVFALLCLLGPPVLSGQTVEARPQLATVRGIVRDSSGHPVSGVTVRLEGKDAGTLTVNTGRDGAYRFSSSRLGEFVLQAEKVGYANATVGPFTVARNESTTKDITLESAAASHPKSSSDAVPAFFDEPRFTVAGVTDTTNLGGHGSDTVVRSREALAKDTASLSTPPSAASAASAASATTKKHLREALERQPADFDANFRLGKLLVEEGRAEEGLIYLERASQLKPGDNDNRYELALARADTGDYERARVDVLAVLNSLDKVGQKKAESHHLLGEVCEKLNDPLEAVREYQRAAELNPSEPYLFDWGAELLLHHAAEPAVEVFTKGNRLFPDSARMLAGLGASWYALGSYEKAAQNLCEASDLDPENPDPYVFMGKMQAVENSSSAEIVERLERFVSLHPANALANYYFAVSVWKERKSAQDDVNFLQVKSLLEKAVQLDPTLGLAYLQLGILYSERKDLSNAIAAYRRAVAATPSLEQAHYRLAQAYRQAGETSKAQAELQLYEQISKGKAAEVERERHQVQQFVYHLRDEATPQKQQ
ncbi:MAG: tetratricopeptide repeat protein [Candidatus Sulfotelmatobacter sp.]